MAKIGNLLDSGHGSVNSLVFYRMNGRSYVRSKPARYRDSKSPAQMAQRQRLQTVNRFLKAFREPLRITFAEEAIGRSALQAAQSYNMRNALTGEYPDIRIEKSRALLSRGPLPLPAGVLVTEHPEGFLISWENGTEASGRRAGDTLVVMALFSGEEAGIHEFTGTPRSKGEHLWKTSRTASANEKPDVWIAFRDPKNSSMSDSILASK